LTLTSCARAAPAATPIAAGSTTAILSFTRILLALSAARPRA
jgi:hypothetical protein